jgi:transposase
MVYTGNHTATCIAVYGCAVTVIPFAVFIDWVNGVIHAQKIQVTRNVAKRIR